MRLELAVVTVCGLLSTGCASTMNVSSYVERGLDFARYQTYDWGPADALPTGDPRLDRSPFFKDHVEGEVEKALAGRGLARSTSPDLLIHYHANISQRIDIDRLDRQYGYCYAETCDVATRQYEAGTLVLDVVDTRTNRLVWRGWAQDSVEDALDDPDEMARQIHEGVTRMLATFPDRR